MSTFNYQARTKGGEVQSGKVEASDKRRAADILHRNGLTVVSIEEAKRVPFYARHIRFFEKIKTKDVVVFSRQLATLLEADVPVVASLQAVARQTENVFLQGKIFEVSADVEGGAPLSDGFAKHPNIFSDFYVNMLRAGEATGRLSEILSYLAEHIERDYHVMSKVRGAMIYPAFVTAGLFISIAVMIIFVIPQLTKILEDSGQDLPILTRIIIEGSGFLRSSWFVLIPVVSGVGILSWRYLKTEKGKEVWDRVQLKLPIFGVILTKVYLFRFTESLATLIEGGIPILKALSITYNIMGNTVYKKVIKEAQESVRQGGTIGGTLGLYPEIPPLVTQMVVVGEQAGKLDSVLHSVASFYQKDVDNATDNITSLIEPILIVIMGIGVGILVVGIMMPIYNMAGSF